MRCAVCGSHQPAQALETAVMRAGFGEVCADGFACASRANGQPRFRLVIARPPPPLDVTQQQEPESPRAG